MKKHITIISFLILLITVACQQMKSKQTDKTDSVMEKSLRELYSQAVSLWPTPTVDDTVGFRDLGVLPKVKYPEENPYSAKKKMLGRQLFFDPRLSASGQIACASCHDSELGWADGKSNAFGHNRQRGKRNTMSILNTAYVHQLFWDGRAPSLEHQSTVPISATDEMNMDLTNAVKRLNQIEGYKTQFREVFGNEEITIDNIQKAIATFERSIVSRKSRFDRFVQGKYEILSDEEITGLHLFRTKARCINCHNSPLFSDNKFHNIGQGLVGRPGEDLGLFNVTGDTADVGKFRTPSLRDVMYTGPWMHHGSFAEIHEILGMYNEGMPQVVPKNVVGNPLLTEKSPLLKKLGLTDEDRKAITAFLGAISTRPNKMTPPELPN